MKQLFIISTILFGTMTFAQNVKFSKKTKKKYDQLIDTGMKSGLSKDESIKAALQDAEYKAMSHKDLADANKKASKKGIMFSKDFNRIVLHKNVAIIPFVSSFKDNVTKKQSKKQNLKEEEALAEKAQKFLYDYLMKNQFKYSVQFQDINRTNQLLKASGILNTLSSTTDEQLAQILGVDGVIRGDFEQNIDRSASLGVIPGKSSTGIIRLTIADGETGEVLWRIQSQDSKGGKDNIDDVISKIMNNISSYFPYSVEFSR